MILVKAPLVCSAFVDSASIKYGFKNNDKCFDCDFGNVLHNKKVILRRIAYQVIFQSLDNFCLCFVYWQILKNIYVGVCIYNNNACENITRVIPLLVDGLFPL